MSAGGEPPCGPTQGRYRIEATHKDRFGRPIPGEFFRQDYETKEEAEAVANDPITRTQLADICVIDRDAKPELPKVISLFGSAPPGEPVPAIVEALERLLAEAKSGKLDGLAFAGTFSDGVFRTSYNWRPGEGYRLSHAMLVLQWTFGQYMAGPASQVRE